MADSKRELIHQLLAQAMADEAAGRKSQALAKLDDVLAHRLDVLSSAELIEQAVNLRRAIQRRQYLLTNIRLIILVVLINAVAIVSLMTIHIGSVDIEGHVEVKNASLSIVNNVQLTPPIANAITLTSFDTLEVDAAPAHHLCAAGRDCVGSGSIFKFGANNNDSSVTLSAEEVAFEYIDVFPSTTVNLRLVEDGKREFIVDVLEGGLGGEVITPSPGYFVLRCVNPATATMPCSKGVELTQTGSINLAAENEPQITFDLGQASTPSRLSRDFRIESLELKTYEPRRRSSSVQSGSIRLVDYSMDPIKLAQGDLLTITPSDDFSVMQMTLDNNLAIRLSGHATTLQVNGRQLKPSLLTWLREHAEASLFVGLLISLTSFVLPLLQRLRILQESS